MAEVVDQLDIKDLPDVLEEVYRLCSKWYDLGVMLRIETYTLDCIREEHSLRGPKECLLAALKAWLVGLGSSPSWRNLVGALRSHMLEESQMAAAIERKYILKGKSIHHEREQCLKSMESLSLNSKDAVSVDHESESEYCTPSDEKNVFTGLSDDLEKLIMTPGATGTIVVEACIQKINDSEELNFPNDNKILRRIAYVMSRNGTEMKPGYNGGIWQLSRFAFGDTGLKGTSAHYMLPSKFMRIREAFGIDWPSVTYEELDVPFLSALGARLYLSNFVESIPPASCAKEQAQYWHYMYMRGSPKAHEDKFLSAVAELNN